MAEKACHVVGSTTRRGLAQSVSAHNLKEIAMRLSSLVIAAAFVSFAGAAHAQQAPDPLFGDDPHAKAVLDCHADYATRYARVMTGPKATPTEMATAAYAHCIAEMVQFSAAAVESAKENNPTGLLDVAQYVEEQSEKIKEYAFARALDTYIKSTPLF